MSCIRFAADGFLTRFSFDDGEEMMKRLCCTLYALLLFLLPGFSQAQDSLNVSMVGYLPTAGSATDIVVIGDVAYIADWAQGIVIIDVSDPTNPQQLSTFSTVGEADDVDVSGDYMAIADRTIGLVIVDVSDPENPTEVGDSDIRGFANALDSRDDLVYFADGNYGLGIYDISDPANPFEAGFAGGFYSSLDVCVDGMRAYTTDGNLGIHIFSINDPEAPVESASYDPPNAGGIFSIGVEDDIAGFTDNFGTFFLLNARVLSRLQLLGTVDMPNNQSISCELQNSYAYIGNETGGLQIVSFVDRDNLYIVGSYSLPNMSAKGVAVANGYVYVAGDTGLYIFEFQDPDAVPDLEYSNHFIEDTGQSNPNGIPDPGETVAINVELLNASTSQAITSVSGTLRCSDESITINDATATWPDIGPEFTQYNEDDELIVTIPDVFQTQVVTFYLDLTFNGVETVTLSFDQLVGAPDLAIVNDYGDGEDVREFWENILDQTGVGGMVISSDYATNSGLREYRNVIWSTSNDSGEVLNTMERSVIENYLNHGGSLLLTSPNVGEQLGSDDWFTTRFAATHGQNTVDSPFILGLTNGPIGLVALSLQGDGGAIASRSPSSIMPAENATRLYNYSISTNSIAGVANQGNGFTAVYLGFSIEAVTGYDDTQSPSEVFLDLLDYMNIVNDVDPAGETSALPVTLSLQAWPNPFNASLSIRYDLNSSGLVQLRVFDLLGREVTTLRYGQTQPGTGVVQWDATGIASGTYLVRLRVEGQEVVRRVQLVK